MLTKYEKWFLWNPTKRNYVQLDSIEPTDSKVLVPVWFNGEREVVVSSYTFNALHIDTLMRTLSRVHLYPTTPHEGWRAYFCFDDFEMYKSPSHFIHPSSIPRQYSDWKIR